MGSTEEITKLRSVKKKLEMEGEESDSSKSKGTSGDVSPDPLEHGIDDDLKPLAEGEAKSSKSDTESDNESEKGACKPRDKSPVGIDVQGARFRNDSESSSESGKSPSSERMKRQRTVSGSSPVQNFIFPGVAASPPKFMSLEEVMKAAKGVSNMVLAHEIAVDKNFKLEKFEPPDNSVEKQVREVMHKAFWDQLAEQLAQEPPSYEQALILIQEVRDNLVDITLPHHTRLRQEISDTLDVELIKQQAEHGVLDFSQYSQYVLSIMARLCAPVRDETIRNLMRESEIVTVFRGVMETLDLMRLDMANFTIQQIRPHIIAQSVTYEKKKFAEFLKTQNDGLELTRGWLINHVREDDIVRADELSMRGVVGSVISRAYLELLSWSDEKLLPETVVMDGTRIFELRDRLSQVCILGSVLLVTMSSVGPMINQPDAFKLKLKRNLCIILDPALSDSETMAVMDNIAEQVVKEVEDHLNENEKPPLPSSAKVALKSQVLEIKSQDHRIRALIMKRAMEFIGTLLSSTTARPVQMPPGLSTLQEELANICGTLLRLVTHNRNVFGEYYSDIITNHIKAKKEYLQSEDDKEQVETKKEGEEEEEKEKEQEQEQEQEQELQEEKAKSEVEA
ncbi:T-complex protein 11-like protein 1 isoform X1 [Penaeus japonicus]|uniref:T-complex protein 11-like protein 1 isoform X1 n=1 Tax=Penaeus japonicus TaxID=27405 RepID=UPI001C71372D|nr:T-complex protein 11-like protein 1 isoform X1 [Penaeus japonicus]XP_042876371.1 T-complex protein 11-like protein 1 isoform X1 [Penaeus japonicus]XP_042876372.1 T-complex protein 11-like protein 1 isoform X1 [Penaeus japonicus]